MRLNPLLILASTALLLQPAVADDSSLRDIDLTVPGTVNDGRYTVRWKNKANARLGEMQYLEESRDGETFYTVYSGLGGTKTFLNKAAGTYNYRIRWQFCFATFCHSKYSEPVEVVVERRG